MRILHEVAGLPQAGGGLAEFVPRLALAERRLGHDVTIATVCQAEEPLSSAGETSAAGGVRIVRYTPSPPRSLFFSAEMFHGLAGLVADADLVHVHSHWTFPVWWTCHSALQAGKPLVISPHGCLDPVRLMHSAWKKRIAGVLDSRYLRNADVIHATSETEQGWIRRYVGKEPRIVVIPSGVELPEIVSTTLRPAERVRQVLYLGRLHPLKGLDLLIEAWQLATSAFIPGQPWRLLITGPDEQGMRGRLEAQAGSLGITNITFSGALHGEQKARALAETDVFVLPSRSENFGIAVAEALAAGVPVITTKATPWSELAGTCGWWVDVDTESLAAALSQAIRLTDAQREAMGQHGRALVGSKFQWESVGRAMENLYASLIDR